MKVEKNQIDALNIELTLTIGNEDYAPVMKKKLNERRRTAEIRGFRKGNAPMAFIEKIYGEQSLFDAVNDIISEQLNKFIEDNSLKTIGEPLASENQPENEWKAGNELVFKFDLGLAPELSLELGKDDKVTKYTIKATAEAEAEMKKSMLMQYGELREVENPTDESYIYVDLSNEQKTVENAFISMRDVAEAVKPALLGVKAGDKLNLNINETLEREGDRATLLRVKKEELAAINPEFEATVVNIKNYMPAELCQETYDKIFGEGKVSDEAAFDKACAERLAENYKQESDYRLGKDIRKYVTDKAAIALPEAFLKRWLFSINKEKFTMEQIEKEFPAFLEDYRWQMICDKLMNDYELKVSQEEVKEAARGYVSYQYAMYGMPNIPGEIINSQVDQMMKDREQVQRLIENVENQKVIDAVREKITLSDKSISLEKFRELA
jgi:trigger factor